MKSRSLTRRIRTNTAHAVALQKLPNEKQVAHAVDSDKYRPSEEEMLNKNFCRWAVSAPNLCLCDLLLSFEVREIMPLGGICRKSPAQRPLRLHLFAAKAGERRNFRNPRRFFSFTGGRACGQGRGKEKFPRFKKILLSSGCIRLQAKAGKR